MCKTLAVTGGTGFYLQRLTGIQQMDASEVRSALALTTTLTAAQLATRIEASLSRARVLPAGIAVTEAIIERINPGAVTGAQSGVRRGLLLAAFVGEI
jgi:exopolyphosphatase/pppGpp-phosphohydrolase